MANIRALIVDDSSVMRKIVERCLRQAGVELATVYEASNGAEGLAVIGNNQVDLILSDINMPVMDGLEFVKNLAGGGERQGGSHRHDHHRGRRGASHEGPEPWAPRATSVNHSPQTK